MPVKIEITAPTQRWEVLTIGKELFGPWVSWARRLRSPRRLAVAARRPKLASPQSSRSPPRKRPRRRRTGGAA